MCFNFAFKGEVKINSEATKCILINSTLSTAFAALQFVLKWVCMCVYVYVYVCVCVCVCVCARGKSC